MKVLLRFTFSPESNKEVVFSVLLSHQKVTKRLFLAEVYDKIENGRLSGKGAILWELRFRA